MIIESKNNKLILYAKKLQTKKYSLIYSECFLETEKIILERLNKLKTIFINKNYFNKIKDKLSCANSKIILINDDICKYLSQSSNPSNIFAIMKIENKSYNMNSNFVVLDNIQDPNNIGAIIRSARAFNFNKIYAINSCYPYLYKTIRSSMGYVFDIDYEIVSLNDFIKLKNSNNLFLYCADMFGDDVNNLKTSDSLNNSIGICIGNEGNGVSSEIRKICDKTISIGMFNNVESLNASVSASIIMHSLNK